MLGPGSRVADRYTVLSELGRGGVATVWLVRHDMLHTTFALKVLSIGSPKLADRLVQEARIQAMLRHPNIVAAVDLVEVPGGVGLVLEYVAGPSLRALLARHRLTPGQAHWMFRGIAAGVARAHAAGLVHRDLKPANVLLQVDPELVPKVTDFGLAKVIASEDPSATRTGMALGTPAYMAPEQIRDASTVGPRADVFSLGAIAYELLTGERPFEGVDAADTMVRVKEVRYAPLGPAYPVPLLEAIDGALVADPEERWPSVADLLAAWDRWPVDPEAGPALARVCARIADPAPDLGFRSPALTPPPTTGSETWQEDAPTPPAPRPAARRTERLPSWLWSGGLGLLVGAALVGAAAVALRPASLPARDVGVAPPPQQAPPLSIPELAARQGSGANEIALQVTELSTAWMRHQEDLDWLLTGLPAHAARARASLQALAREHGDEDLALAAQYQAAMVANLQYSYTAFVTPPRGLSPDEQARWRKAIDEELKPSAEEAKALALQEFRALADSDHPLASTSLWPRTAAQMVASLERRR